METIHSPKRRLELELHGTKSQKASVIDTAVKASQKTVFFYHQLHRSVDRLINRNSMVTQLWNLITVRNPEDGDDTFSETSVRTRPEWHEAPEVIYNKRR
jgi:hypothetical protein